MVLCPNRPNAGVYLTTILVEINKADLLYKLCFKYRLVAYTHFTLNLYFFQPSRYINIDNYIFLIKPFQIWIQQPL